MKTPDTINGKTPEEIKKGLAEAPHVKYVADDSSSVDGRDVRYGVVIGFVLRDQIASYISALELYVSQVSKALCGKENGKICEVLDAISQVKSRLAQAERERDAAVADLRHAADCDTCKHQIYNGGWYVSNNCMDCSHGCNYEWRGVCRKIRRRTSDGASKS